MKTYILAGAFACLCGPIQAGGLDTPTATAPTIVAPAAPELDWSGAYAGLQFGSIVGGNFDAPAAGREASVDGELYGVFAGYRFDFGNFVAGAELDYFLGNATINAPAGAGGAFDVDVDRLVRLGGELGWDLGRTLVYGTAGFANVQITDPANDTTASNGYFYGIGADVLVSERVTLGIEVLQHEFTDFDGNGAGAEFDPLTVGLNLAVRF